MLKGGCRFKKHILKFSLLQAPIKNETKTRIKYEDNTAMGWAKIGRAIMYHFSLLRKNDNIVFHVRHNFSQIKFNTHANSVQILEKLWLPDSKDHLLGKKIIGQRRVKKNNKKDKGKEGQTDGKCDLGASHVCKKQNSLKGQNKFHQACHNRRYPNGQ